MLTKTQTDFINKTEKNFKNMLLEIFEDNAIDKQEKILVCAFMTETLHNVLKEAGVDEWFAKNFVNKELNKKNECFKNGKQVHRQDELN